MKFLTEQTAPPLIIEALQLATSAKLAVAFWGDGAVARLGIGQSHLEVEIICNLESGACNPAEIRRLVAMTPAVQIRSNPRLHGKLYWTANRAVVGSSNASANGLAVEGQALAGWAEANVSVDDPQTLDDMRKWFDDLFQASHAISDDDLLQAEDIWKLRRRMAAPGVSSVRNLLEAYRMAPAHPAWDQVKVAYWTDPLGKEAEAHIAAIRREKAVKTNLSGYEGWSDHLNAGDWVLDYWFGPKVEYQGVWHILTSLPASKISLAAETKHVRLDAFGRLQLAKADASAIGLLAKRFIEQHPTSDGRNAIVSLREAVTALAVPNLREFEKAMQKIYTDSKAAGYTPSAYRTMLDREGAIPTARKLVFSRKPSDGFAKLWELKRLDLTVEHLVLQERWRGLFDEEMLAAAQRRLDQFSR